MATPEAMRAILEGPSAAPPPGVVPNFVNPHNMYTQIVVSDGVCFGVATVVVALRLFTKVRITHDMGWDDCEFEISPDRGSGLVADGC